jgi:ClpP class serine protease
MDNSTMMNAKKAKELGFIDEIMYLDDAPAGTTTATAYSFTAPVNSLMEKIKNMREKKNPAAFRGRSYEELMDKLMNC